MRWAIDDGHGVESWRVSFFSNASAPYERDVAALQHFVRFPSSSLREFEHYLRRPF